MSYTNAFIKPVCYADAARHNLATPQCSNCVHKSGCAEAIAAKARIDAIKKGSYQPGSLQTSAPAPAPAVSTPVVPGVLQVAPPPVMAVQPAAAQTTTAQPAHVQQQALVARTAVLPVATAANSSVVYERGDGTAGRELLQRATLSGVAAVFEELGRFMRHDGYRLSVFRQPARLIRCATCNHINEPSAKFCSGCGRSFGPST